MLAWIKTLFPKPDPPRAGYAAFGTGEWKVRVRVYRAAEDRWYDLEEVTK